MNTEKNTVSLRLLSEVILEELKGLASTGKKLSSEALFAKLSSRSEFSSFLEEAQAVDGETPAASEIASLKARVEKSQAQREKLLKQLSETEDLGNRIEGVYRSALLTVIEMLPADDSRPVNDSVALLKEKLKERVAFSDIQEAVKRVKETTLRGDLGKDPVKEPAHGRLLDKLFKRSPFETKAPEESDWSESILVRLREAYSAMIGELKLNLDGASLKGIDDIEGRIHRADGLDAFSQIRKEIMSLIQDFISRVSGEREEAAAFIREIGERLVEVESHILESFPHARETHRADSEFSSLLEQEIGELRQRVDFSKTLAELKRTVALSLSSIQQAIEEKRKKDESKIAEVDRRMEQLQQDIGRMRKEIASARMRADALEKEVLVDPLTGIYNRRAYEKRIKEELFRYLRHQRPFSILLLDVDHFKKINDQYGHAIGDLCLKEIIKRIRPLLRESDFLARFGGEEFILLLPETLQPGAEEAAEKLRSCIEKTEFLHRGELVGITISIGVTQVKPGDQEPETLFHRVDKALYQAKDTGRNRVFTA
ncbi:MAG: GGDEF domain-containing protein [Desulfobacteraceae bacterium]|nr:MAG: GGDEF domain-containing protein [Desulfobacteraceae bacterium]